MLKRTKKKLPIFPFRRFSESMEVFNRVQVLTARQLLARVIERAVQYVRFPSGPPPEY